MLNVIVHGALMSIRYVHVNIYIYINRISVKTPLIVVI